MSVVLCKCGCGVSVPIKDKYGRLRSGYVHNHHTRKNLKEPQIKNGQGNYIRVKVKMWCGTCGESYLAIKVNGRKNVCSLCIVRKHRLNDKFRRRTLAGEPLTDEQLAFIVNRDHHTCQYCGKGPLKRDEFQFDHRIAVAKGGKNTIENVCVACVRCNQMKNSKSDIEFLSLVDKSADQCFWKG